MPKAFLRIFPPILGIWKWPRMVVIGMFANDSKKGRFTSQHQLKIPRKFLFFSTWAGNTVNIHRVFQKKHLYIYIHTYITLHYIILHYIHIDIHTYIYISPSRLSKATSFWYTKRPVTGATKRWSKRGIQLGKSSSMLTGYIFSCWLIYVCIYIYTLYTLYIYIH